MTDFERHELEKAARQLRSAYNDYRRRDYPQYKGHESLKLEYWCDRVNAMRSMGIDASHYTALFDHLYSLSRSTLYPQQALSQKYLHSFVKRGGKAAVHRTQLKDIEWSTQMILMELNAGRSIETVLAEQYELLQENAASVSYSEGIPLPKPDYYDPVVCFLFAVRFRVNQYVDLFRSVAVEVCQKAVELYRQSTIGAMLQEYGLLPANVTEVSCEG